MSRRKEVRLVILAEDKALGDFIRRTTQSFRAPYRVMRTEIAPRGRGSAKHWIERQYPIEVKAHRRESNNQQNLALIVATDSDEQQVKERTGRLADTLSEQGIHPRGDGERIALWIPKRNIETWLLSLSGEAVTEDPHEDYRSRWEGKRKTEGIDFKRIATEFTERFRRWKRQGTTPDLLPSLETAFQETRDRLPFA